MRIFSDKVASPLWNRDNKREGSSLAESMVALGLVVVGLLGIVVLYTRSFVLNREVVNQTIAAGLAAEGIEVVRNIVDTRIAEGTGWTVGDDTFEIIYDSVSYLEARGKPLRFDATNGTYTYNPAGEATPFRRTMTATTLPFPGTGDEDEYRVTALVEWEEGGTTQSLEVEDHFFRWRP